MNRLWIGALAPALLLAACIETRHHVVVEQPKPLEININFTGHLDLVIRDARQDLEQITGERPANVVRLEDIGLPAAAPRSAAPRSRSGGALPQPGDEPLYFASIGGNENGPVLLLAAQGAEEDLKAALAARNAQVRALWDAKLVGESYNGLLEARGTLTADQQKLMQAENTDRSALYAAEAKSKNSSVSEVALAYYVARLGYAKAGNWYQKRNAAGTWEWVQWGS